MLELSIHRLRSGQALSPGTPIALHFSLALLRKAEVGMTKLFEKTDPSPSSCSGSE